MSIFKIKILFFTAIFTAASLLSCAGGDDKDESVSAPFAELVANGIEEYVGLARVTDQTENDDGSTTYAFDIDSGPICLYGEPYRTSVRDNGSQDLVIFLQGGGACWTGFCYSFINAPPGIPDIDVLNPEKSENPVRDWNVAYLPYCDGSLFAGNADIDADDDGEIDRYQRGMRNLTAALDVAVINFPAPRKVLLAGSSAGGFGTIPATFLVRIYFPNAELYVFNDAGVGIVKGDDPQFIQNLFEQWNIERLIPASCVDCMANGHLTDLVDWQLSRDPTLKIATFSSYGDSIIAGMFLNLTEEEFKTELVAETSRLRERFPERYKPFLIEGIMHTTLLGDVTQVIGEIGATDAQLSANLEIGAMATTTLDGIDINTWLGQMVTNDPAWAAHTE